MDYDFYVALDNPKRHGFPPDRLHTNITWLKHFGLKGDVTGYKKTSFKGIDREQGNIGACNGSLFAAINIALNMGFKEIDIYGADMRLTNGYCHFYSESPCEPRIAKHYEKAFFRHQSHKKLFMSQLRRDEKINWINELPPEPFSGVIFERIED